MASSGAFRPIAAAVAFGAAAARPAAGAGNAGTLYYATDTHEQTLSDGVAWNRIGLLGPVVVQGNVDVSVLGAGVQIAEGANAKQGLSAAMVAGTLVIANTSVTANSRIHVTRQDGGTNPGAVFVSARAVGVSFTVTSTNVADTGQVAYDIFEPG